MRCQRCGFEMEPGQTFCSMCGTEQSRAKREKKPNRTPKSILWVIKIVSKSHFRMWLVFLSTLIMSILVYTLLDRSSPLVLSSICLSIVLLIYGYKNPNSTKTKAYKIKYRMCAILMLLLLSFTMLLDFNYLARTLSDFISEYR